MNKLKKLLALLLCAAMTLGVMPALALAEEGTDTPPPAEGETITRAQWLSQLVEAFGMTVESDDDLPDNYFSDLDPESEYYRDILVAVQYGLVDIEAGDPIHPDDPATREFAAQTVNSRLLFQLDEGTEYTYNEHETVKYPKDIQVAVNREWLSLDNGNFMPEQPITAAEAKTILADAREIVAGEVIDKNHENKYEFADGVIIVPENAGINIDPNVDADEYTVHLTNCDIQINEGDIFVIYADGVALVFKAASVEKTDGELVVVGKTEGMEGAVLSADIEGSIECNPEDIVPTEAVTYSVINTTVPNAEPEDLTVKLQEFNYNDVTKVLTASYSIKLGGSAAGSISLKMTNMELNYKGEEVFITANTTLSASVSFDLGDYAGIPKEITLAEKKFLFGACKVKLNFEFSLEGGVTSTWNGNLKVGFSRDKSGYRFIHEFTNPNFNINGKLNANAALRLVGSGNFVIASGEIWGVIGARFNFTFNSYSSGTPKLCEHTSGYVYAEVGVSAKYFDLTDLFDGQKEFNPDPYVIFDKNNSPVRFEMHYEDSLYVEKCTRAENAGKVKYTTPTTSKNFNPSPDNVQSSYPNGGGSTGGSGGSGGGSTTPAEPVVIWKYDLDKDNNATITGYYGNASALAIPSKIDGYTVTGIGANVFENNKRLRSIIMPNAITTIGAYAFSGCDNLSNVNIPKSLVTIGVRAFYHCTSLTQIEIPKTLENASDGNGWGYGTFEDSGLNTVKIDEGLTKIPSHLFRRAYNLKNVEIPDTVTEIGNDAFVDCTGLTDITLPDTITTIGAYAFSGCDNLSNVNIPKSLVTIGVRAFYHCTSLTQIEIPKTLENASDGNGWGYGTFEDSGLNTVKIDEGLTKIPSHLFRRAYNFKNVEIPDTVTEIGNYAFYDCTNLTNITLPDTITKIGSYAFSNCESLPKISIPDTVNIENFGSYVFDGCTSLEKAKIPDHWTEIKSNTFNGCESLSDINLPSALTKIGSSAFQNCKSLDIEISDGIERIEGSAFMGCDAFTEITIPESVTYLGGAVFMGCQGLKKITVNTNCDISSEVFRNCDALENVSLTYGGSLGGSSFAECDKLRTVELNIGGGVGNSAFSNCPALEKAVINAQGGVGESAFIGCKALTSLTFGDGVTSIGTNLCYGCELLNEVNFGKYIETIPDSAFRLCPALETVKLPHFLKTIAANAFAEDTKLVDVYVPAGVSKIENNSFSYPAKTTMHGRAGSYAEEYANSRNMTFDAVNALLDVLEFENSEMFMNTRESVRPVLNMAPDFDTSIITFSSSDESIAAVSETGVVTAKNFGDVVITAATDDGLETNIKIMIINPATSVTLNKNTLDLAAGGSETLTITYRPNNSNDTFEWSSSNEGVARVDQSGNVTAIKQGEAVITVKAVHGSATASCKVYVVPAGEVGKPRIYVGEITPGTDGKTTVEVDTANVPNRSTVFVTAFDESGNQIGFGKATVANDEATATVPTENTKSIKVFCWESLKSMRPLCEAKEVEVTQ